MLTCCVTQQGDVVVVNRTDVGDGWWEGEIDGQRGLFPSSFVKMVSQLAIMHSVCVVNLLLLLFKFSRIETTVHIVYCEYNLLSY